jgi:anaerobic ribonucleoside-triphosphate reductase activating protein
VDGPGVRYSVFLQGCAHSCSGCHNPATHSYAGGEEIESDTVFRDIISLKYIKAVTFSGGEPLDQAEALIPLMKKLRALSYNICVYTGYTFEEAAADPAKYSAVCLADILVDGRFELAKRTLSMPFVGSENQRVIDVQKSLRTGEVALITPRDIDIKIA